MGPILIVIPAFNAEASIANVIDKIIFHLKEKQIVYEILVVDDGSSDSTARTAEIKGATVIRHYKNLGKGEALKTSFKYAISKHFFSIVTMDADLQHDPASLPLMLDFYIGKNYDLIIGARAFNLKKMTLSRVLSNRITSRLIALRTKQSIPDSQSGYRVIRTEAIQNITLNTSRYETESEILIRLGKMGFKIGFYPIETIYQNEKSHINHVLDTIRFAIMYLRTFIDH